MNIIYKLGMYSRMVTQATLGFRVVTIIKHKIKLSTLRVGYQRSCGTSSRASRMVTFMYERVRWRCGYKFAAMVVLIVYVKVKEGAPNTILYRHSLVGHTTLNFFSVDPVSPKNVIPNFFLSIFF